MSVLRICVISLICIGITYAESQGKKYGKVCKLNEQHLKSLQECLDDISGEENFNMADIQTLEQEKRVNVLECVCAKEDITSEQGKKFNKQKAVSAIMTMDNDPELLEKAVAIVDECSEGKDVDNDGKEIVLCSHPKIVELCHDERA